MNRIGKFRISHELIDLVKDGVLLKSIMSNFLIVRAESIFAEGCIEYVAYSNLFEDLSDMGLIPMYGIWFKQVGEDTILDKVEKIWLKLKTVMVIKY